MRFHVLRTVAFTLLMAWSAASRGDAQEGTTFAAVAGGALGVFSGGILGTVGGVMPCGYARSPSVCSSMFGLSSAAIAGFSGARIGAIDRAHLEDLATSAAIGTGVGLAVGVAIRPFLKQHYGVLDVLAIGAIGGAVGASPKGAGIGFGFGLAAGSLLWLAIPQATSQDALQVALLGLAIGGISGWVDGALTEVAIPVSLRF